MVRTLSILLRIKIDHMKNVTDPLKGKDLQSLQTFIISESLKIRFLIKMTEHRTKKSEQMFYFLREIY